MAADHPFIDNGCSSEEQCMVCNRFKADHDKKEYISPVTGRTLPDPSTMVQSWIMNLEQELEALQAAYSQLVGMYEAEKFKNYRLLEEIRQLEAKWEEHI